MADSITQQLKQLTEQLNRPRTMSDQDALNSDFHRQLQLQAQELFQLDGNELASATRVRHSSTKKTVQQRIDSALAAAPESSGPLNSPQLVRRSLELMQEISPSYLTRFVSYIDTLQWLEEASEQQ